jgi:cell wall-associated NlpC family hydrolase
MNSFTTVFIPIALFIAMTQVAGAKEPPGAAAPPPLPFSNREPLLQRVTSGTKTAISSTSDNIVSLIDTGLGYLGIRYRRGGNGPESGGFDCSGLVKRVFGTSMGLSLPRTAAEMAKTGDKVSKQELMPGDLVFFNTLNRAFSHVGIYLGNSQFLHSPSTGGVVRVESMDISYWRKRFNGGRRLVQDQGNAG